MVKKSDLGEIYEVKRVVHVWNSRLAYISLGQARPKLKTYLTQSKYDVTACGRAIDGYTISPPAGIYGYDLCSRCGTKEDFQKVREAEEERIRQRLEEIDLENANRRVALDQVREQRKNVMRHVCQALGLRGIEAYCIEGKTVMTLEGRRVQLQWIGDIDAEETDQT